MFGAVALGHDNTFELPTVVTSSFNSPPTPSRPMSDFRHPAGTPKPLLVAAFTCIYVVAAFKDPCVWANVMYHVCAGAGEKDLLVKLQYARC